MTPTASIAFGRFFAPAVGARLHVNGWQSKGGFKSIKDTYKFNYVNTDIDLLLNLTNLISKRGDHFFNVILVGGVGLNYAWHNKDLDKILAGSNLPYEPTSNAWGEGKSRKDLLSHNLRAGVLLDFNIAKHWNIGVEVDFNSLDDRFNSKYSNRDDWMMTAQLSVTYKFGLKDPPPTRITSVGNLQQYTETEHVETPPVTPPNTDVVEVVKPLKEVIYYEINVSDPRNVDVIAAECARWAKENPTKKLYVTGYADKGTGTSVVNQRISDARAKKMVDALKQAGVIDSQIVAQGVGDTVQPFTNNDDNRCVIIEGK